MKTQEILNRVRKEKEFQDEIYIGIIAEEVFNIYDIHHYDTQTRLTSYYFGSWYCTDNQVGYKVYFF